jgi:hypothetical protein
MLHSLGILELELQWKGEVEKGDRKYLIYLISSRLRPHQLTFDK